MQTKYLVVGGGVAGTSAAETIRAKDKTSPIHIVSDEPYRFYSRIMLSKPSFFLGKVPFDSVFLKNEAWAQDNTITTTFGQRVVSLDTTKKVATLGNGDTISYEKLLLALGCDVCRWTIPGADKKGVHYLRTLDDAKGIIENVKGAKRAVVIGGGFIGFEMCDMLKLAGLDTTLIIREKYFWEPLLDEPSGRMIEKALQKGGVNIIYGTLVDEVTGKTAVEGVQLNTGTTLPTDMIIVGIGTRSTLDWVTKSGIACNRGVLTDEFLRTNEPDVYAAGDAAEYNDAILEEHIQFGNWANAQLQGKVAAENMMGGHRPFRHVSFYSAQGLGMSIVFAGDIRVLPDRTVVTRGTPASNGYTRIIIKDGEIEGATMINRTLDLQPIVKLIELNVKVEPYLKQLSDPSVDLKSIIPPTP